MKKLLFLALIAGMFFSSCKDDGTVTPGDGTTNFKLALEQKNAGFYFTGNWCGPCGLYGKPALENLSNKHGDNFVWVSCQINGGNVDPFNNADADAIHAFFSPSSVPTIFVGSNGDQFQDVTGGPNMESILDGYLTTGSRKNPLANIGIEYTISDGAIVVTTETEFFEDSDLEFAMGVYIIEDNLLESQTVTGQGSVDNTTFNNILRLNLSANVTGDVLPLNAKKKGQIDEMIFTDFLQSNWKIENLRIVAVLWAKTSSGEFKAVNATVT